MPQHTLKQSEKLSVVWRLQLSDEKVGVFLLQFLFLDWIKTRKELKRQETELKLKWNWI